MSVETFLENLVTAAEATTAATLGDDGQKVVTDAVAAAEALTDTSGTDKFSAAVTQAGTDLLTLGKDVPLYLLHLAIEAAASKLNVLDTAAADAPAATGEAQV